VQRPVLELVRHASIKSLNAPPRTACTGLKQTVGRQEIDNNSVKYGLPRKEGNIVSRMEKNCVVHSKYRAPTHLQPSVTKAYRPDRILRFCVITGETLLTFDSGTLLSSPRGLDSPAIAWQRSPELRYFDSAAPLHCLIRLRRRITPMPNLSLWCQRYNSDNYASYADGFAVAKNAAPCKLNWGRYDFVTLFFTRPPKPKLFWDWAYVAFVNSTNNKFFRVRKGSVQKQHEMFESHGVHHISGNNNCEKICKKNNKTT